MVEQIMYIGIGFLIAGLLVIGVIPLVHARAVRLTMRRLEALTPLSIAEIQADKDQLRAEFAMTMSRLEMSVEQMKAKTTNQLAELSRKSEAIGRLKLELGEKRGRADNLANRIGELDHQLTAQTAESEVLGGRVQELAAQLNEQGQPISDREGASEDFRNAAPNAQKIEAEIRAQLAELEDRHRLALATIKTEKSLIETELKRSQDERDKLQREMAAVKRDAA